MSKISTKTRYIHNDGWRGYYEPIYHVAGANDTGTWDDSPCPTPVAKAELMGVKKLLTKNGIRSRHVVCKTSNIFCLHRYLVVSSDDFERAMSLVTKYYIEVKDSTRLLYINDTL
jgi:hypothetical protein